MFDVKVLGKWVLPALIVGIFACCAPVTTSATPLALSGDWGGDRANLKVGIDATQVEFDCGMAVIEGRLQVDAQGAFSGSGYFEDFADGPVDPDMPPKRRPTMFRGQVSADILDLTIQVSGETEPRRLRLVRGHRVKLVRCF